MEEIVRSNGYNKLDSEKKKENANGTGWNILFATIAMRRDMFKASARRKGAGTGGGGKSFGNASGYSLNIDGKRFSVVMDMAKHQVREQ